MVNYGGWLWSFIFISMIGVIGLLADYWLIPRNLPLPSKATVRGIIRVLTNPQLLFALLVTALGYGGTFVVYTYLSPLLEQQMHWSASAVVLILVVYGLMVALGNTTGWSLGQCTALNCTIQDVQWVTHHLTHSKCHRVQSLVRTIDRPTDGNLCLHERPWAPTLYCSVS